MSRQSFSGWALIKRGLSGHLGWEPQWRKAAPKPSYDAVIVGGGGHGLGAAYYLAKEHGMTNIAVLEKGWIGGGNTGRNTTIIRSNYLFNESAALYDHAVKMWENLSQVLNYNVMYSPSRGDDARAHGARHPGIQAPRPRQPLQRRRQRMAGARASQGILPAAQHPGQHPLSRPRGRAAAPRGTARHDAVAWGYARAADALGVDIIENCEVTGIRTPRRTAAAWKRWRPRAAPFERARSASRPPASTSVVLALAGVRLPLESYPLQALVSEPIKPIFPCVVMSNTIHAYISQSDKGELVIGAGTDAYTSYTQRGALHINTHTLDAICELFPQFRRLRMLRNWGGIVDVTPDRSPIIGKTPVRGLYVNCGWGTGGFKATPGSAHVFAWTIARDEPHPINAPFTLERFRDGYLIDEAAAAAVAH